MAIDEGWPRPEDGQHAFEFRPGPDARPAAAITEAVTWLSDAPAGGLGSLDDVVDPDWLRAVFTESPEAAEVDRSTTSGEVGSPSLAFEYGGCVVTVETGRFTVERATEASPRPVAAASRD